jgi:NADPH:quinone reductase-like Zn-dependent oxidoreductase
VPKGCAERKRVRALEGKIVKAVYLNAKAGPDALILGEIQQPRPKEGEVLVRVHATAIMPAEVQWSPTFTLQSGESRPFPIVLSHEFSGVIESVGAGVNGIEPREAVYGLNDWFTNGAQAEYCVVAATALARKPKKLDHVESAIVPISALTAWQGLFERAKLERDQRVLIHGAAGGVGTFAVQLARWRGAHVTATASSANLDFVHSLGANEVLDYRNTRFEDVVKDVDVVFDGVGGDTLNRSWRVLKAGGKLVTIASQSIGASEQRNREAFLLVRADGSQLVRIANMIDAGKLRVFVARVFPLTKAREAYACAQQGGLRGKIALRVARRKNGL